MAGSLNRVELIGNVGNDPEIKSLNSGDRVANFSIATSESWKDKATGEKKERTEWHRVCVFNQGLIGVIESWVKKGSKVYLSGQLQTRKYEKNGSDHYTTEIVLKPFVGEMVLLGSPGGEGGQRSGGGGNSGGGGQTRQQTAHADLDDEIPF